MESTEASTRSPQGAIRDGFLGGRLSLAQPKKGYRAGMDAALLAAACDARAGQRVIEAGCGVGAALLSAALRRPQSQFTGIERDAEALALCRENIAANGLGERVRALRGEVGSKLAALGLEPFDAAMANPPFFDDPDAIRGPAPEREGAWIAEGGLEAWTRFLLKAVREGGTITLIHRANRLADILALLGKGAGSFRVRPIHPFADEPAKRVLVRAVKTGKAPLALLPPLVLHDRSGGKHTPEADAILKGEAELPWN
ncbi:MAG TPA: methyltransferase [Caulobacteraceae bacterium]|jgi:tRNA1(Val) A37 N6-methylase TrmN6